MGLIVVDQEKCTRDGACVAVCPVSILELREDAPVPTSVTGLEKVCIRCGHCVAVCAHGALTHEAMTPLDCAPVGASASITPEQVGDLLRSRRSIRAYRDRPIEREKIERLLDLARTAPTGGNSQSVHWKVAATRKAVRNLASMVIDLMRPLVEQNAPMAVTYNLARSLRAWEEGRDPVTRGAPAMILACGPKDYPLAAVDCSIALTYVDLAAPSLGLGTCWGGFVMLAAASWPPMQQALELPDGYACYGAMMLGYPKYRYHRAPKRNEAMAAWMP